MISNTIAAPTPQELELPHFDEQSVGQGNLTPQGFTPVQRDTRQARDSSVVRYFYEQNEDSYKYT